MIAPALFDPQATAFDRRVGLADGDARAVAALVVELAGLAPRDVVLEIGAGTGQIGSCFAELPVRYLGLDLSLGMLDVFRRRLPAGGRLALLRADGDRRWPVGDGTVRAVFGSRALHLLEPAHVAAELVRAASPRGATLWAGRVRRAPESVRERMAREMRRHLRARGFVAKGGGDRRRALADACAARGAEPLAAVTVARWTVSAAPRRSLASWESLAGLGGTVVPAEVKSEVLTDLANWADEALGGLDRHVPSEEVYELEGFRLPPR